MEAPKLISRTVKYIWEPGRTDLNARGSWDYKSVDSSPDMFTSIRGCCDSVFSSVNEDSGCVLTVLHGLYDCEKAAKDLKLSLEQNGNNVCLYDFDNTDISTVYSETHMRRAGLKSGYIKRHKIDVADFIKSFLMPLLFFLLPFTFTVLEKIANAKINIQFSYFIWGLATLSAMIFMIIAYKSVQKRANTTLSSELINKLNELNEDETKKFIEFHCDIANTKLYKPEINIFLRFDKLQHKNQIVYFAIQNYINNTHDHKQVNIIFVSQNQMQSYLKRQNHHYKYGVLSLNQLSFKEKNKLRKELNSSLHISKLDYFGVDAIWGCNRRISDKYNQEDMDKSLKKLEQYGVNNKCDTLAIFYLIAYFSCKYDIYMSIPEMTSVFQSRESSKIVYPFISKGTSNPLGFTNIIDFIVRYFDQYLILHSDGRYKFSEELLLSIEESCPTIPRIEMGVWCINVFLHTELLIDKERLLLHCGETFNALTSDLDAFRDNLKLFTETIVNLLKRFEQDAYYYYYEDIFTQLLYYANKYQKIIKQLTRNDIIEAAAMNNMIFSPGRTSWEQYRDFVKLQADAAGSTKLTISEVPLAFTFFESSYEKCNEYYLNLLKINNEKALRFHEVIFSIYLTFNRLNLTASSFNLFNIDEQPTLKDLTDFFPRNTQNEQINYIHETIDELHEIPQHLLIISEYIYYPITQLLACLSSPHDNTVDFDEEENDYLPEYNTNCVYDLIAKSCSIPVSKADYKRVIDIVLNNNFGSDFKCRYFMTLSIMHNLYGNEIEGFIKANINQIINIIKNTTMFWEKNEAQLYHFFEALILLAEHIEHIDLVQSTINSVSEKYPLVAEDITICLEYIVGNKRAQDSKSIVAIVERVGVFSNNLAFLVLKSYCEDDINLEILKKPIIVKVVQNATITSSFKLILRFLLIEDGFSIETSRYLYMFTMRRNYCNSKISCDESMRIVDKYYTQIRTFFSPKDLKQFFINRESYLEIEEFKRNLFLADSYMLALSYNVYLITRFFPDEEYENKTEPMYSKIEEKFLQTTAIQDVGFPQLNTDYFFICVYILNNSDIQKKLIALYGRKRIVEHIRENAVLLLSMIIKRVSDDYLRHELETVQRMLKGLVA